MMEKGTKKKTKTKTTQNQTTLDRLRNAISSANKDSDLTDLESRVSHYLRLHQNQKDIPVLPPLIEDFIKLLTRLKKESTVLLKACECFITAAKGNEPLICNILRHFIKAAEGNDLLTYNILTHYISSLSDPEKPKAIRKLVTTITDNTHEQLVCYGNFIRLTQQYANNPQLTLLLLGDFVGYIISSGQSETWNSSGLVDLITNTASSIKPESAPEIIFTGFEKLHHIIGKCKPQNVEQCYQKLLKIAEKHPSTMKQIQNSYDCFAPKLPVKVPLSIGQGSGNTTQPSISKIESYKATGKIQPKRPASAPPILQTTKTQVATAQSR